MTNHGAYAHPLRRVVAYLLDALIIGLLIFLTAIVINALLGPTLRVDTAGDVTAIVVDPGRILVNALVGTTLSGVYFVGSWSRSGRTPGQAVFGIMVAGARDGSRLDVGAATVRWIALGAPAGIVSVLVRPIPGAGLWLALVMATWIALLLITTIVSPVNRGLHDRFAGSVVLRSRRRPERPPTAGPTPTSGVA